MNKMIAAAGLGAALFLAVPATAVDFYSPGKGVEMPIPGAPPHGLSCPNGRGIDPIYGCDPPTPKPFPNPANPWLSDEERRHQETIRAIERLENAVRDQTIILDRSR